MSLGLTEKFNILSSSPFDQGCTEGAAEASVDPSAQPKRWVPSRFTVRARTTDGRLVLWNTYTGELTVFDDKTVPRIERMLRPRGIEGRRKGAIEFMADRGFIVEEGTDELRRFRYAFGRQHNDTGRLHLLLLASEDCNFRCKYCYEEFARGTMEPRVRAGVKNYLRKRISGLHNLFVEWFGGEPLYGMAAIEDIAPFALQLAQEHNISHSSKMTTNGYLLTPDVVEKLLSWNIRGYQISLDGTPEHHDCNRPTRDGRGTFAVIFRNLVEMRSRPETFLVSLRVNFDKENAGELNRFLDLAAKEFAGDERFRLNFRPVGRLGGPNDAQLAVCGSQESIDLDLQLREEARKRGLNLLDSIHHARGLGSQVCYAARPYSFLIGATGKIMKCTVDLDMKDRNVVGLLSEDGEMQLDEDKMALWTEPAFESDSKCQKCFVLPACQGITCPLERWEHNHSPCPSVKTTFKIEMRQAAGDFELPPARRAKNSL